MKACPVLGCQVRIKDNYLMCPDCWRCLPAFKKRGLSGAIGGEYARRALECIEYVGAWKSPLLPEAAA